MKRSFVLAQCGGQRGFELLELPSPACLLGLLQARARGSNRYEIDLPAMALDDSCSYRECAPGRIPPWCSKGSVAKHLCVLCVT